MKKRLEMFEKLFAFALRAYPRAYRDEFAEEMLAVFSETIQAAAPKGFFALLKILLREVVDLPSNVIKQHLMEAPMGRSFYSNIISLIARLFVGYGVGFFIANSLLSASIPFAKTVSLIVARWASSYGLTQAFPTTDTFLSEISLVFWVGLMIIPGFVLGLLLGQKKNLLKIMLIWMAAWILPAVFMTVRLSHWFGLGTGVSRDLFIPITLDEFVVFINCVGGATIGYFVSLFINDQQKLPWFLLTGAISYPIVRELALILTKVRLTAPENIRYVPFSIEKTGLYYAAVGLLLGIIFAVVSTFLTWRREKLLPA
jgi:hypothetical protein